MATSTSTSTAIAALVLSVFMVYMIPWVFFIAVMLSFILLGAVMAVLRSGYKRKRSRTLVLPTKQRKQHSILYRMKVYPPNTIRPTIVSTRADISVQEVLNLILRHHVAPLYEVVAAKPDEYFDSLKSEVWRVLHALLRRASQIDMLKLFSADSLEILRGHFAFYRLSKPSPNSSPSKRNPFPNTKRFPYLKSREEELKFLRRAIDAILCVCLPREYLDCTPVRVVIREFIVTQILHPTIDRLCQPDYINQKLLTYLIKREEENKSSAERYLYSKTYEDFITHIQKCEDVSQLTQIRRSIITDIMQAKAVQRMKEASSTGVRGTNLPVSITADKAKSLMDRDLKLYITQLTTAKIVSDRRIRSLGGEIYQQDKLLEGSVTKPDYPRPIPFETIMLNDVAIVYFLHYLELSGFGDLVSFWKEVQDLIIVSATEVESSVKRIYSNYLVQGAEYSIFPDPDLLHEVERTLRTDLHACMEAISKIQQRVFDDLRDHHYQGFIHSVAFKEFMDGEAEHEELSMETVGLSKRPTLFTGTLKDEDSLYKTRLTSLKKKLKEQDSTLAYLPKARSESKAQQKMLEKGRTEIQEEIKQLQRYIEHTEEWFGTIGRWNVEVTSVDLSEEGGNDKDPLILVVVHRPVEYGVSGQHIDDSNSDTSSIGGGSDKMASFFPFNVGQPPKTSSTGSEVSPGDLAEVDGFVSVSDLDETGGPKSAGWVIGRRFSEFQDLHNSIHHISKDIQFPPNPTRIFSFLQKKEVFEKNYWDKYRQALQSYLNTVVHNSKLQENEVVFNFLSPASADLNQSGFFKDPRHHDKHMSSRHSKTTDTILDHVSAIITEVFNLQERRSVLRRQIYDLMQLTFGSNIEGELQDFMKWVTSEPMLVYYIETFRDSLWPDGLPAPPMQPRTDLDKETTREDAKQRFLNCAPQTLQTILGQRNCQIGLLKIFELFQDPRANKQLFYSYFELLLYELIPELKDVVVEPANDDTAI